MPDGLILGFDTSAAHCAAALLSGERVLAERFEPMDKGQAERLMPLLAALLSDAGVDWPQLTAIGVGTGPGNFTGIRIAVAAARGLALGLGVPAIGVPVTEALALDLPRPCRVVMPSRRGSVIWQDFAPGADAASTLPQQSVDAVLPPGPAPATPLYPLAVAIARIAATRRDNPGPRPAPVYLRPADAAPGRDVAPAIVP